MTLHDCLAILKGWSRAHPNHVPILLTFNAKDDSLPQTTQALKFDAAAFDAMDAEIRSVLDPKDLITPDDVQLLIPPCATLYCGRAGRRSRQRGESSFLRWMRRARRLRSIVAIANHSKAG